MATSAKVRGITIELGADTSKLVTDLKSANSAISKTQKELKDVDKLLKFNPGNITLIKQRTQALQTQIGNTKNKLEELKKAEQTMKSKGVDENSEQFRALQREIIATESKLKELEGTAGSGSAALFKISESAGKIGENFTKAGKALMPVTAGITALGAAAIKSFKDVDAGADEMIKKTGATGDAATELKNIYEDVATSVVGTFEDAGNAVGEINTRFGLTGDTLKSTSEEFLKFAKINNQDVNTAVAGVAQAMKTFNVDSADTAGVLGKLTDASQKTGISVDTLESLLQSSGAQLKEMGLDLGGAVDLMASFESQGIDSASMLSRLGKGAVFFQKKGLNMEDGLKDLIERLKDSSTEAEATTEAYEIFGSRGGLAFITAAKEGKIAFGDLSKDLKSYSKVVDSTYNEIIDETDQMQLAWKNAKVALADAGKSILSTLAPAIEKLANFIKNASEKWRSMDDSSKKLIITIGGIVAAIAPALLVFGKFATAISAITKVMSTMKFAKFLTSPITLAIAAVAGLVAGLVTLFKKLEANNSTLSEWSDELEASRKKNEELKSSLESTASEYDKSTTEAEKNAGAAEGLKKKLDELMAVEEKSEAQKEQIRQIVEELNEIVPNLGLAYKEEADKLNLSNEQIQRNIDLRKEQARVTASSEAYQKTIADVTEAEIALDDAERTFNEMLSSMSEDRKAAWEEYQRKGELAFDLFDRITYIDDMKKLEEAERNVADAQSNLNGLVEKSEKYWDKWQESNEALTEKQGELQKEINKTDLKGFREELGRTFGKDLPASLNKAVNHAKTYGVEIPEELKQGILDGSTSVEDAVEQINKLVNAELAKAPQEATKTGAQIPTNQASAMQGKKGLVKEAALNLVKDSSLKQAETNATTSGSNTGTNFGTSLGAKQGFVTAKANGVVGATNSALKKTDGKTPATNAMNQYGSSIWSNRALAINNAGKVASGTGSALGKTGASKQGKEVPTLFSAGILGGVYKAYNAAWKLAGNANSGAKDNNYGKTRGQEFAQGYVNGINGMLSLSYSTGFALAQQALLGTADGQKSKSPSKLAMGLGNDFGEGYEIGLNDYLKKIFVSAKGLAASALSGAGDYSALTANRMSAVTAGGRTMPAQSVVNYTQNNYSPRALSTSDIYRQSKNLLNLRVEA